MVVYVIALEPEKEFYDNILEQKKSIKEISLDQIYIDHPPHITVYIMFNKDINKIKETVKNISNKTNKISLEIKGLNYFRNDNKTNTDTIFYEFIDERELRNFEYKIISSLSNIDESKDKYNFLGDNWHPHITITSIKKEKFSEAFNKLKENELTGRFNIDKVVIYSYIPTNTPIKIKSYKLKDV